MRKFFNSLESSKKHKGRDRIRAKLVRLKKRAEVLKRLQPEIDRISASSQLAESLTQLITKKKK